MQNLDDVAAMKRLDPEGMLARIAELPREVGNAWDAALKLDLPARYAQARALVVLGMGGSAIGGDLLRSLVTNECKVPIQVSRDYDLPGFVGPETLVIASSYSGNTEETLTAFHEAERRGAMVLASTGGGTLLSEAKQKGYPVYHIQYKAQPRAALAHSFIPLLAFCQRLGFIADQTGQVHDAVKTLQATLAENGEEVPTSRNRAKQLAARLFGRLPVIYGAGIMSEVARRWKTQINENTKGWCFFEVLPELNHNAILGYEFPPQLAGETAIVFLRARSVHARTALRYLVTSDIVARAGVQHEIVDAQGSSPVAEMMSVIMLGDLVSCYLAFLYGVNPTPVETIEYLKTRLAGQ